MKFLTAAATMLLIAMPLAARDRGPEVAAWYVWMQPGAEGTFNAGDPVEPFDVELSGDTGYGLSGTLFLGNRISAELAVSQVKTTIELDELDAETRRQSRTSTIMPITATLQYHFAPDAMVDPYIGVVAAHPAGVHGDVRHDGGRDPAAHPGHVHCRAAVIMAQCPGATTS